jgi:hypothetical protein
MLVFDKVIRREGKVTQQLFRQTDVTEEPQYVVASYSTHPEVPEVMLFRSNSLGTIQKHDFLEIGGLRLEFNSDDTPEDAIAEAIELYNQTGCYYYEGHFHE